MRTIRYSREALKTLDRLPANTQRLLRAKISQYASDPDSLRANVKMLKGSPGFYRLRVGSWRIIFRDDGTIVAIVDIGPRGSVYQDF